MLTRSKYKSVSGNMQQDQAHPQLYRVFRQPSRLEGNGTRADRATRESLRGTGVA